MKRHFKLLLLGMCLVAILPGCKKSFSRISPSKTPSMVVAEARAWFQQNVQTSSINPTGPDNPRDRGLKFPIWDQARALETSDRPVVIVPLHYRAPMYIMNHAAGSSLYAIDQVAHLVIYRDSLEAFHAEVVTALPESPVCLI